MFKKFSFAFCSLFLVLFFVSPALAADLAPQKNPLCWTKENCEAQIKANGWDFNEKLNWLKGEPNGECGSWGGCIPAGQTQLSITLGEQGSVMANLGDYIKKIYLYLIGIGALVATILIIKGGFEWTTSAGNPTRVTSAKSSITGALLGLFLLLGSYTLLYTINPDLLRLKLPRVFMVRALTLGTEWCKDQGKLLVLAQKPGETVPKDMKDIKIEDYTVDPKTDETDIDALNSDRYKEQADAFPVCGARYYFDGGGNQTCAGHLCPKKDGKLQVCAKKNENTYECVQGILSGVVTGTGGIDYPFIDSSIRLMGICKGEPLPIEVQSIDVTEIKKDVSQNYVFTDLAAAKSRVEGKADCGFYLLAEINGASFAHQDDWYAVGKNGSVCNKNLQRIIGWPGDKAYNDKDWQIEAVAKFETLKPYLLQISDFEKATVCDMPLSRSDFSSLRNIIFK